MFQMNSQIPFRLQDLEPPASKSVGPANYHVTGYREEASFSDLAF